MPIGKLYMLYFEYAFAFLAKNKWRISVEATGWFKPRKAYSYTLLKPPYCFSTLKAKEFTNYEWMLMHLIHGSDKNKHTTTTHTYPMEITTFPNPTDSLHHLRRILKIKEISFMST